MRPEETAVAISWVESAVRALYVTCDAIGWLAGSIDRMTKTERLVASTDVQRSVLGAAISSLRATTIPAGWWAVFDSLDLRFGRGLRYGFAADLIAVLEAVDMHRAWPELSESDSAPEPELEAPYRVDGAGQLNWEWPS